MLPGDITPEEVFDLAMRVSIMGPADIEDLNKRYPGRIQSIALMAAVLFTRHGWDEPQTIT